MDLKSAGGFLFLLQPPICKCHVFCLITQLRRRWRKITTFLSWWLYSYICNCTTGCHLPLRETFNKHINSVKLLNQPCVWPFLKPYQFVNPTITSDYAEVNRSQGWNISFYPPLFFTEVGLTVFCVCGLSWLPVAWGGANQQIPASACTAGPAQLKYCCLCSSKVFPLLHWILCL